MSNLPRILNRSAIKPVYLLVVEDPTTTEGIAYYKSQDLIEGNTVLEFRGFLLTKQQADKISKNPHAEISAKTEPKAVNRKIPLHRVIRIENTTYQKPQGESNE
jgi:hypothetical protein